MAAASQDADKDKQLRAFSDFARLVLEGEDLAGFEADLAAAEAGSKAADDLVAEWGPRAEAQVWPGFIRLQQSAWSPHPEGNPLRFGIGDRVQANCGPPQAGGMGWQAGTVVGLWYRERPWPPAFLAPYQLQLDANTMLIYAPVDGDGFVRRLDSTPPDPADKQKELLLGYGDSWEVADGWMKEGFTGIHVASGPSPDPAALKELLRRPLPLCIPNHNRNPNQETPLHMAARYGQVHCAMLLLAAGHDPRKKDSRGKSATDVAASKAELAGEAATPQQRALVSLLRQFEELVNADEAAGGASSPGGAGAAGAS